MIVKKVAIFAFNGELMCFGHALLNAFDMKEKGCDVKLTLEGTATRLIRELLDPGKPSVNLYDEAKKAGLIDCVCRACSDSTKSLESAKEQGLPICDEMSGHPTYLKPNCSNMFKASLRTYSVACFLGLLHMPTIIILHQLYD